MIEIIKSRTYGQPKLPLLKELKGIRPVFSYPLNRKCKCNVYVKGDDIYIKHRDWMSTTLYDGKQVEEFQRAHGKFVYNDCYGTVVLRGEAWFKLDNALHGDNRQQKKYELICEMLDDGRYSEDDERMFGDVFDKLWIMRHCPERYNYGAI